MTTSPLVQTLENIIQPFDDLRVDDGKHNKQISNLIVPFISTHDAQQFQQLKRELCVKIIKEAKTVGAGGQAEGMATYSSGSGGVAFLHPSCSDDNKAQVCLYKITLTQFKDLLLQENMRNHRTEYSLVGIVAIDSIRIGNPALELIKLMEFSGGRIVLALEGGHNLGYFANSFLGCVVPPKNQEKYKLAHLSLCFG
eukprot:Gb_08331 [translate_table: standard]